MKDRKRLSERENYIHQNRLLWKVAIDKKIKKTPIKEWLLLPFLGPNQETLAMYVGNKVKPWKVEIEPENSIK